MDKDKTAFFPRFFKTSEGSYGEGDQFIGVTVPNLRKVSKNHYKDFDLKETVKLLTEPIHEYRLAALFILVYKFEKAKNELEKEDIVNLYLNNVRSVNNWDLVDSSADKILGPYFFAKDKELLYNFAHSSDLWKQRIAIISTFYFIKKDHFQDTLDIAKILLNHKHDLIHKAVGWMLREIGNRKFNIEYDFLKDNYKDMPRTMLRYAIEKFEPGLRQQFLKGYI
ncbi:MAG: DNA alkylation repair protein [Desulfitobacteriaceae bacterium]